MSLNRQIVLTSLLLLAAILFFGLNDIDLTIQDMFYNFGDKTWLLGQESQPYKFIFYDGIKKLLIAFAVVLVAVFLSSYKIKSLRGYRQGLLIVILSAAVIPVSVGALKKETNMPCPKGELRYGGFYPRTAVWDSYDENFYLKDYRNKCWPAGHASGGFALLSLFFLFKKRRHKILSLVLALVVGWTMGIYKMIIGDHFFSHTVITMILAWLLILLIAKFIYWFRPLKL